MRGIKRGLVVGIVAGAAWLVGCNGPQGVQSASSSGSLALSSDDSLLYAADTDNGKLSVIDTKSDAVIANVSVGVRPFRVVVGPDDTVYVANRGSRSISVIHKGEWTEAAKIPTGVDPSGLALGSDGKTLYIVNATSSTSTDFGTLMAVDTTTLQTKWEINVGAEPRAIAMLPGNQAVITLFRGGSQGADLVTVDLNAAKVVSPGIGLYNQVNFTRVAAGTTVSATGTTYSTFDARGITDVVASPDGKRVYAPTVWAREDAIGRAPGAGGYYAQGGPCNLGSVATAGLVTATVGGSNGLQPDVDDLTDCEDRNTTSDIADFPPTAIGTASTKDGVSSGTAVQGPSAVALDSTGEWLYMVNKETSNVALMPAYRRTANNGENIDYDTTGSSIRSLVSVNPNAALNSGPDGIALARDGLRMYVYNQFDHEVVHVESSDPKSPTSVLVVKAHIPTGLTDTLPQELVTGRRFFFDAMSTEMSSDLTHVSCATCHLEGRDDAHTWTFPDGKRQTPALVGRQLAATKPYHWSGAFGDFHAFMKETVTLRMGGAGTTDSVDDNILGFLDNEPAPENANVQATPTAAQQRGAQVFVQAQCSTCHLGAVLTDNLNHDVGTATDTDNSLMSPGAFNVPSLLGIALGRRRTCTMAATRPSSIA